MDHGVQGGDKEGRGEKRAYDPPSQPVKRPAMSFEEKVAKLAKAASYHQYQNRLGPANVGKKPIPAGAPNCLEKMVFVITGILDSFERETIEEVVKGYGGRVTKALSGKTTHVIVGRGAGPSKLEQAEKLKTKQITEDDFLELIRNSIPSTDGAEADADAAA